MLLLLWQCWWWRRWQQQQQHRWRQQRRQQNQGVWFALIKAHISISISKSVHMLLLLYATFFGVIVAPLCLRTLLIEFNSFSSLSLIFFVWFFLHSSLLRFSCSCGFYLWKSNFFRITFRLACVSRWKLMAHQEGKEKKTQMVWYDFESLDKKINIHAHAHAHADK